MAHHRFNQYTVQTIAAELNRFARYFSRVRQLSPLAHDTGTLLENIDNPDKSCVELGQSDDGEQADETLYLLNGNLNHSLDIHLLFEQLGARMQRADRIAVVVFNPYFRWLYRLAESFGLRKAEQPLTFITRTGIQNIARTEGMEMVRLRNSVYCPVRLFGLGNLINKVMPCIPLFRWLSLATVLVLRPLKPTLTKPSLSIVIPARNESGNIENALKRLPNFDAELEVVYVEGNSTDDTYAEIERVIALPQYAHFNPRLLKQPGKGKKDATMFGFDHCSGDLVTVLDADLTMPPEVLPRFYQAWCDGHGDMINGNRLLYPMEDEAMRFLNRLGNIFFAKALNQLLDVPIGDSLCGTKLFTRRDHQRFMNWLADFGEFDPFGDFQMLFPAAELCLGTVDIPIRYGARSYGSTNIHRFRHGLMLLKMTWQGYARIRAGAVPHIK
jgi:hypothetical protein